MLNLIFSGKDFGLVSPQYFMHDFFRKYLSFYILLTDQISLPDCLYFSKYWVIGVLKMFVNQAVASLNLNFTISSLSSRFAI